MNINTLTSDSLLSTDELTSARLSQIDFISSHVQLRVAELAKKPEFDGQIPSKIFRCHISNYVRDNIFGRQNAKKILAATKRTNAIQVKNERAEFLPYNDKFISLLKELFISSLFSTKQSNTERTRMIVLNEEMVDVKSLIDTPDFLFINEIIDISYLIAATDAGVNTFNVTAIGQQLRATPAKAGSLNLKEVKYHKQSANRISKFFDFECCDHDDCFCNDEENCDMSPFTISSDDDYNFTVFFPSSNQSPSTVLITNEERFESLDDMAEKLQTVKKYPCFSKSNVYMVNIKNGTRSQGDMPVEVYEYKDEELVTVDLKTPLACCMVDFSGVSRMVERVFSLARIEIEDEEQLQA